MILTSRIGPSSPPFIAKPRPSYVSHRPQFAALAVDMPSLSQPAFKPRKVYHISYESTWEAIQASGGLKVPKKKGRQPVDKDFGAIFGVDQDTMNNQWCRPTRYFGSYMQAMTLNMVRAYQEKKLRAVMLEIDLDYDTDKLYVRDVSPVLDHLDPIGFERSRVQLADYKPQPHHIPEVMIANDVPLSRIRVAKILEPGNFPDWRQYNHYAVPNPKAILERLMDPSLPTLVMPPNGQARPIYKNYYYNVALLKFLFHKFTRGRFYDKPLWE